MAAREPKAAESGKRLAALSYDPAGYSNTHANGLAYADPHGYDAFVADDCAYFNDAGWDDDAFDLDSVGDSAGFVLRPRTSARGLPRRFSRAHEPPTPRLFENSTRSGLTSASGPPDGAFSSGTRNSFVVSATTSRKGGIATVSADDSACGALGMLSPLGLDGHNASHEMRGTENHVDLAKDKANEQDDEAGSESPFFGMKGDFGSSCLLDRDNSRSTRSSSVGSENGYGRGMLRSALADRTFSFVSSVDFEASERLAEDDMRQSSSRLRFGSAQDEFGGDVGRLLRSCRRVAAKAREEGGPNFLPSDDSSSLGLASTPGQNWGTIDSTTNALGQALASARRAESFSPSFWLHIWRKGNASSSFTVPASTSARVYTSSDRSADGYIASPCEAAQGTGSNIRSYDAAISGRTVRSPTSSAMAGQHGVCQLASIRRHQGDPCASACVAEEDPFVLSEPRAFSPNTMQRSRAAESMEAAVGVGASVNSRAKPSLRSASSPRFSPGCAILPPQGGCELETERIPPRALSSPGAGTAAFESPASPMAVASAIGPALKAAFYSSRFAAWPAAALPCSANTVPVANRVVTTAHTPYPDASAATIVAASVCSINRAPDSDLRSPALAATIASQGHVGGSASPRRNTSEQSRLAHCFCEESKQLSPVSESGSPSGLATPPAMVSSSRKKANAIGVTGETAAFVVMGHPLQTTAAMPSKTHQRVASPLHGSFRGVVPPAAVAPSLAANSGVDYWRGAKGAPTGPIGRRGGIAGGA
eukprot:TRINITY_DN26181_c0_g1_i2.p1 TRINITY_DN26181_c0_g1~~TRINITY_DN26181_c0_g1_i2.p1  ORF type:complete len:765 (+),score=101.23 TRINITY_DN26181_c0_g1_i2:70-2364(+)